MDSEDIESQEFQVYKGNELGNIRLGFVRKVYSILSVQLLFTSFLVYLAQTSLKPFFQPDEYTINPAARTLFYLASAVSLITFCVVACYTSVARKVPLNYSLLALFTLCEGYIVAFFTTFFQASDVILAAILTLAITVTLTLYAYTTKTDFTVFGGILWVCGWALLALTILLSLFAFGSMKEFRVFDLVVSVFVTVFYGVYLIYDTQMIMGGRRFELSLDDYILAALVIYIDVIVLFMRILRILAALRHHN